MKNVPIEFKFSTELEKDVMLGKAGDPGQVGKYVTHYRCPACGLWTRADLSFCSQLLALGLRFVGSRVVNDRLHFDLVFEKEGVITVDSRCDRCGEWGFGILVPKGPAAEGLVR